jgi:hypothetical protein
MTRALLLAAATILIVAACGSGGADSGGLTSGDRSAAQAALDRMHGSNISLQLATITRTVQAVPAACRVHLASEDPRRFKIYVFWVPWLGSEPYTWLHMTIAKNPSDGEFHLGTATSVLPGGRLSRNGQSVDPWSLDTTILSRYGPQQVKRNKEAVMAHAGDAFAKPGANCQVLQNGDLRLVPNP